MKKHKIQLRDPWLLAVWPGMGNIALAAGGYLVAKLEVQRLADLHAERHFDLESVQVRNGIVLPGRMPKNRFYGWKNPQGGRDLVIFVGEAQPTLRSYEFCQSLLGLAREFGVRRVFTFASLVTSLHPSQPSRVFAVTSGPQLLEEIRQLPGDPLPTLEKGEISGLNGTLLAAAAAQGQEAIGFLGEVPQVATGVPYLKASHAVLEVFCKLAEIEIDFSDLVAQANSVERGLLGLVQQLKDLAMGNIDEEGKSDATPAAEPPPLGHGAKLPPEAFAQIESLFLKATLDRSLTGELKAELDSHGVFKDYEDRFLDLFRNN